MLVASVVAFLLLTVMGHFSGLVDGAVGGLIGCAIAVAWVRTKRREPVAPRYESEPVSGDPEHILRRVDELVTRFNAPAEDLHAQGWSEEGAADVRAALEQFAAKVRALDAVPPPNERLNGMVRLLDYHGLSAVRGPLKEDLSSLVWDLRNLDRPGA